MAVMEEIKNYSELESRNNPGERHSNTVLCEVSGDDYKHQTL